MPKRVNGEGTLRLRPDGRWEFRIWVDTLRAPKSFYSRDKDGRGAKAKYTRWLRETGGVAVKADTVKKWAEVWAQSSKYRKLADKTKENYQHYVDTYIIPALGHKKAESVLPMHIEAIFAGEKVSKMSESAQRDIRVCLNRIFKTALKNNGCVSNPVERAEIAFPEVMEKPPEMYSAEELQRLIPYAQGHKWGHYVEAALYTGLRESELCGLLWANVDLEEGFLLISNAVTEIENTGPDVYLKPDKNKRVRKIRKYALKEMTKSKRRRVVVLSDEGLDLFARMPRTGLFVFDDLGFVSPPKYVHRYEAVIRDLNRSLPEGEQVRKLSPHKSRHTYASHMLEAGATIESVREQLGHSRISTTQGYLHADLSMRRKNAAKLKYIRPTEEAEKESG